MMSEKLNAGLIEMLVADRPEYTNPAGFIAETLNIGREAAYRRLRGEVLFTFSEAAQLALKLNLSLDQAMGRVRAGNVLFQLQFNDFYSTLEKYNEVLERDIRFFRRVTPEPNTILATAGSMIPPEFFMRYEHMAKFKFFKWLYQHGLSDPNVRTYEQLQVPESLVGSYDDYVRGAEGIKSTCYVFDNVGFKHWINAIRAFRAMHLISDESIRALLAELMQLLDLLEELTVKGRYPNGNKVMFYLSDIDLESAYSYLSTPGGVSCSLGIFSLNSLRTSDPDMLDLVKRWIQTQMRFSTLISESGELQRIRYFKRQRELLAEMERESEMPSPEAVAEF